MSDTASDSDTATSSPFPPPTDAPPARPPARPLRLRGGVQLVPLGREHAPAMFRWMCDPQVRENVGVRAAPTPEKTLAWVERAAADESIRPFAAVLAGRHVGNVVLDRIDPHLQAARLSVYVGEPDARGAGVGRTAIFLALCHAFRAMGLHKVWLTVHQRNAAAVGTYLSLGFALEGILRDEFRLGDERLAALYMGLLRPDFERLAARVGDAPFGEAGGAGPAGIGGGGEGRA